MSHTIKIAFIGLGEHQSRAHLKHLLTLQKGGENIEFVGAYDPLSKAFDDVTRDYGISLLQFSSPEDLLAYPGLSAVFISSPDEYHTEQLQLAVARGLHVFCEKPISVTVADAEILAACLSVAQRKGLVVSSCHPRRFDPPFMDLKAKLPELIEQWGPLKHFDFSFWYHEVTDAWKKDRSLLSDHFGHEIDLVRFLFGASSFTATKLADGYDFYEVTGTTNLAMSFRFMGSRALEQSVYNETVRLDFAKGALFYNLNTGVGIELPSGEKFRFPAIDYDARFLAVNKNFLDSVRGDAPNYLSHRDILCNNLSSVELTANGHVSM
jgi:predicted dehydrogenase